MNLHIRKMEPKDLEPLHRLLSDPDVMRYLEPPFTMEKTKEFLNRCGLSDPPLVYAVDADGEFAGYVICHDYDEKSMEIGWVLFPEYWEKGYASQLTDRMLSKARHENKDAVIECDPDQAATKSIARNFGFIYEGCRDGLDIFRLRL